MPYLQECRIYAVFLVFVISNLFPILSKMRYFEQLCNTKCNTKIRIVVCSGGAFRRCFFLFYNCRESRAPQPLRQRLRVAHLAKCPGLHDILPSGLPDDRREPCSLQPLHKPVRV